MANWKLHYSMYIPLGFRKKVSALAEQKDCQLVGEWECSLVNHMYWCVVSTTDGDGDIMKAKWLSVDDHIHNVHSGHSQLFQNVHMDYYKGEKVRKSGLRNVSAHHIFYMHPE